jgi:Holliday junction resolvasome RuvABC endonuclease subunit
LNLEKNKIILGIDTASRTGWCIAKSNSKNIEFNYGFIHIDTKNDYFKYNEIIKVFDSIIKPEYDVIIEDTFFRFNPKMFRLISRIGAIAYTLAHIKGCKAEFIAPSPARKNIGFKGNVKKAIFQKAFLDKIKFELTDIDIIDALVLSLNGLIKKETLI